MSDYNCYMITLLVSLLALAIIETANATETLPWGVERIHAHCVWDNNRDMIVDPGSNAGQSVSVIVIDSGIDYWEDGQQNKHYHPDLSSNIAGGRGFRYVSGEYVEERPDYEDDHGHGTHVAGTIAAVDNDIGVIGTAPKAKIYALKLFTWDYTEVVAAINWALNPLNGIPRPLIISMSLGYPDDTPQLHQAVDNAYAGGALLIAGAGNDNEANDIDYPARYDSVIAVGAVNRNGQRWVDPSSGLGSDMGPELEFVAPGVNIYSTYRDEGYEYLNGTSMAVPHVTATAALIWSSKIDPEYQFESPYNMWSNTEVREKLKHLALDLGPSGRDNEYGYGLINAWATNQRPLGDIKIDYTVNMYDVIIVSVAFGSTPSSPNWDPRADILIDNVVNVLDAIVVTVNYGKSDP